MILQIAAAAVFFFLAYPILSVLLYDVEKEKTGERLFIGFAALLVLTVVIATVLAVIGIYSLGILTVVLTVFSVPAFCYTAYKKRLLSPRVLIGRIFGRRYSVLVLLALLAASILYFFFPTSYLVGARDPGLYTISAVRISQTGSYRMEKDTYISENYSALKDVIDLKYPGIYSDYLEGMSNDPGDRTAQFLPMFPATLAIGYDFAGIDGLIRVNAVISIFSLLAAYYFVKRFFGSLPARITVLLFLVNPAQIWAARITQTEILSQFLFFLSVWLFGAFYRKAEGKYAVLAGALVGIGVMNRIDILILGLGVYAIAIYAVLFSPSKRKFCISAAAAYTCTAALSVLYMYFFSHPYFINIFIEDGYKSILWLNAAFAAVLLLSVPLRKMCTSFLNRVDFRAFLAAPKVILPFSFSLLALFLYAYFLRPVLSGAAVGSGTYFVMNAMAEFCYYTSFAAVILAVFGFYRYFASAGEESESVYLFFLIGMSTLIGYIYRPSISPDHIWASRRWITIAIPFVLILCAYAIPQTADMLLRAFAAVHKKSANLKPSAAKGSEPAAPDSSRRSSVRRVVISLCITVPLCCFGVYQARVFLFERMFGQLDADYRSLCASLDDSKVYFTEDERYASVLHYVYKENVYLLQPSAERFAEFVREQGTVNYIGTDITSHRLDIELNTQLVAEHTIEGTFLSETIGSYPQSTYLWSRNANVYTVTADDSAPEAGHNIPTDQFYLQQGELRDGKIYSVQSPGYVFFGPYAAIAEGTYEITVQAERFSADGEPVFTLDAAGNKGETIFGAIDVVDSDFTADGTATAVFTVTIPSFCTDFEVRCFAPNKADFAVSSVTVVKVSQRT